MGWLKLKEVWLGAGGLRKHGQMCVSHKVSVSGMCHYLIVVAYQN